MRSLLAALLLLIAGRLPALHLAMAPLAVEGQDLPGGREAALAIAAHVETLPHQDQFQLPLLEEGPTAQPPRFRLEAAEWCAYHGIDFLVFGLIHRGGEFLDGRLQIYDAASETVHATLVSRDGPAAVHRLLEDLAVKLHAVLSDDLGIIELVEHREKQKMLWDLIIAAGWFTPLEPWSAYLMGTFSFDMGAALTPARPLFYRGKWDFYLRYGAELSYGLGLNRQGYEDFQLHLIQFTLPVTFCVEWNREHRISFGAGPLMNANVLIRNDKYANIATLPTSAFGVMVHVDYMVNVSSRSSIGISNDVRFIFYDPLLMVYRLRIVYEFDLTAPKGGKP